MNSERQEPIDLNARVRSLDVGELKIQASTWKKIYDAFESQGFTADQALHIVIALLTRG